VVQTEARLLRGAVRGASERRDVWVSVLFEAARTGGRAAADGFLRGPGKGEGRQIVLSVGRERGNGLRVRESLCARGRGDEEEGTEARGKAIRLAGTRPGVHDEGHNANEDERAAIAAVLVSEDIARADLTVC